MFLFLAYCMTVSPNLNPLRQQSGVLIIKGKCEHEFGRFFGPDYFLIHHNWIIQAMIYEFYRVP